MDELILTFPYRNVEFKWKTRTQIGKPLKSIHVFNHVVQVANWHGHQRNALYCFGWINCRKVGTMFGFVIEVELNFVYIWLNSQAYLDRSR